MDNFVIENGWQENIYFSQSYSVLYYTVHDTSLGSCISYKRLLSGDTKIKGGGGGGWG